MCLSLKNQDSLMRAGLCPHALSSRDDDAMTMHFCTASETSLQDTMALGFSQQSKGIFLFSTAIAASHVNNSIEGLEDGVVNSPPSRLVRGLGVCSPSPLRGKDKQRLNCAHRDSEGVDNASPQPGRASRQLYSMTHVEEDATLEEGCRGYTIPNTSEEHATSHQDIPSRLYAIEVKVVFP